MQRSLFALGKRWGWLSLIVLLLAAVVDRKSVV